MVDLESVVTRGGEKKETGGRGSWKTRDVNSLGRIATSHPFSQVPLLPRHAFCSLSHTSVVCSCAHALSSTPTCSMYIRHLYQLVSLLTPLGIEQGHQLPVTVTVTPLADVKGLAFDSGELHNVHILPDLHESNASIGQSLPSRA